METDSDKSARLFSSVVNAHYWMLFLPHNCTNMSGIANYRTKFNAYFPAETYLKTRVIECTKELRKHVLDTNPNIRIDVLAGLSCLERLMSGDRATNYVPIFKAAGVLLSPSNADSVFSVDTVYSLLSQLVATFSDSFKGDIDIHIPIGSPYQVDGYRALGKVSINLTPENNLNVLAPFWKWYRLLEPLFKEGDELKTISVLADSLALSYMPVASDVNYLTLPFFNVVKICNLLKLIYPSEGRTSDNSLRCYSALNFVTNGIYSISCIDDHDASINITSIFHSTIEKVLKNVKGEASSVSATLGSRTALALESFRLSELDLIEKKYYPDDELDSSLDPDGHDATQDVDLDPGYNHTGDYSYSNISKEADDNIFDAEKENSDGGDGEDAGSDDGGTAPDSDSSLDDSDGSTKDDTSFGDSGMGGDPSATPDGNPSDPNKDDKDKVVSSKNKISKKAYKSMWGDNPFKLANDSDPEGYFYRMNVSTLNKQLQEDPGDAIPRSAKNLLNRWCKFWMHCSDVRFTVKLLKGLGLDKYLKV